MSPLVSTIILFGSLLVCLFLGLPIAFSMGGIATLFTIFAWGVHGLPAIALAVYKTMNFTILLAIPLFVFMAQVLQKSGVADDLYSMMHAWFGPLKGGLAMATVAVCTMMGAMSGVSTAGVVTMGIIALPEMLKRKYSKTIAIGPILAGGALAILIPPVLHLSYTV